MPLLNLKKKVALPSFVEFIIESYSPIVRAYLIVGLKIIKTGFAAFLLREGFSLV